MTVEYQGKSINEYVAILLRRLTVALGVFTGTLILGVYFTYSLPETFRSTGLLSIEQQNVAPDLAQATGSSYVEEQIELVWQRVMLTASLAPIIQSNNLYPSLVEEDQTYRLAAQRLRANTFLEPQSVQFVSPRSRSGRAANIAFTLSFDHSDGVTAQAIATELANLYVRENEESRSTQAQQTVEFLQLDIENARSQVDRAAESLASFKEQHAGNLPELLNFHLQSIERTEQQLDSLDREIRDSRNRLFTVETELARTNPFGNSVDADGNPILGTADRLAELQTERLRLLSIYTSEHADVKRIEREIEILTGDSSAAVNADAIKAQLEVVTAELQLARQTSTENHPDVVRLRRSAEVLQQQLQEALAAAPQQRAIADLASRDPVVQQLQQQVETERSYNRSLLARRAELEGKLDELRGKVASMPQIEREYELLAQQNEFAIERYNEAVERIDAAELAQSLEAEGGGERVALLEAPFLPENPYSPNRAALLLLTIMVAIGAAVGGVIVAESLDETVKDTSELLQVTGAPPLAIIPVLENDHDRRVRVVSITAKSALLVGGLITAVGIATVMSG